MTITKQQADEFRKLTNDSWNEIHNIERNDETREGFNQYYIQYNTLIEQLHTNRNKLIKSFGYEKNIDFYKDLQDSDFGHFINKLKGDHEQYVHLYDDLGDN